MSEIVRKMLVFFGVSSLFGWIFVFVGISARREQRRREESEHTRASGVVVEYTDGERHGKHGPYVIHRPVIEFTADGAKVRKTYENSLKQEEFPVGTEVEVLYDVNDPARFHLESDLAFSRGSGNLMKIGLVWVLLAALLTFALAIFVGGWRPDISHVGRDVKRAVTTGELPSNDGGRTVRANNYSYQVKSDGTAALTGYSGPDDRLVLPFLLDGHMVTGISGNGFARATGITALTVPGSITFIPMGAFVACVQLTDLSLQEGVSRVGSMAFGMCASLRSVTLPASLTDIADDAFPDSCAATFEVPEGSEAERFCREKGYTVVVN